jgi:hypothetical protein
MLLLALPWLSWLPPPTSRRECDEEAEAEEAERWRLNGPTRPALLLSPRPRPRPLLALLAPLPLRERRR